ncbi:MAG: glycoside hydrolase family 130 protein [Mangrovibacterium sp.]
MTDIAKRFAENPLLSPCDLRPSHPGLRIECLLNPGVFRFDGKVWLLIRVAERPAQKEGFISFPVLNPDGSMEIMELEKDRPGMDLSDPRVIRYRGKSYLTTLSHLRLVCSDDGINFREPDVPVILTGQGPLESFGIEDCRVTPVGNQFYLTYTAVSENGVGVGLMSTENWRDFERHGVIFPPHNKDCTLINEKIGGYYYAFHRPSGVDIGGNYIWLSQSPDLLHWGNHRCMLTTRPGWWDGQRIGAGASPVRTEKGWLEIYHGADKDNRYCLGAFLCDLNDPSKVLARSGLPVMEPVMPYEQAGFFGNVVFTNGHVVNGDEMTVYYGASDEFVCGARFSVKEILESLSV